MCRWDVYLTRLSYCLETRLFGSGPDLEQTESTQNLQPLLVAAPLVRALLHLLVVDLPFVALLLVFSCAHEALENCYTVKDSQLVTTKALYIVAGY